MIVAECLITKKFAGIIIAKISDFGDLDEPPTLTARDCG